MSEYEELLALVHPVYVLRSVEYLLYWDMEVMMPKAGTSWRGEQLAALSAETHRHLTNPRIGSLLDSLAKQSLSAEQAAVVREVGHEYRRSAALPAAFVETVARHLVRSVNTWREAKAKKDFALFAPILEQTLALKRQYAQYIAPDSPPYQVLLEDYEPGAKLSDVTALLEHIKAFILELLPSIRERSAPAFWEEPVAQDIQLPVLRQIVEAQGFDFHAGRLDTSSHPFSIWVSDARITVRFTQGYAEAIAAAMHETGHALYNMGLDRDHLPLPLAQDRSMAVHESQSRLWEMQVGSAEPFWSHFFPLLKEHYPPLRSVSREQWMAARNRVERTPVRVGADEVTYPLHVILRFELEQALIAGELAVKDLPAAWSEKLKTYLGIEPKDDAEGVLQDIHWAIGDLGYFPTYVMGSALAAQLFAAAKKAIPSLEQSIASGDCKPLLAWLREHIHKPGRLYPTEELIVRATGRPLSAEAYTQYLQAKYC